MNPQQPPPPGPSPGPAQGRPRYEGRKVVGSILLGLGVGLIVAMFLKGVIANTPVVIPPRRIFRLFVISGFSGALVGLAIESMRQLQASNPDPAYHQGKKRRAGRGSTPER